jgi:hypothetical protein
MEIVRGADRERALASMTRLAENATEGHEGRGHRGQRCGAYQNS